MNTMVKRMLIQDIFFDTPPAYANSKSVKMASRGQLELLTQSSSDLLRLHTPISPNKQAGPLLADIHASDQPGGNTILTFTDKAEASSQSSKRRKLRLPPLFHV